MQGMLVCAVAHTDQFCASNHHALLVVFQAMDTAGKDGAIRHLMSGINRQGCWRSEAVQGSADAAFRDPRDAAADDRTDDPRHPQAEAQLCTAIALVGVAVPADPATVAGLGFGIAPVLFMRLRRLTLPDGTVP